MSRNKAVFFVLTLLLIASIFTAFKFWPKKYMLGTTMPEAIAFWNDKEAFLFVSLNTTGRAQNVLQEKLAHTRYGYLAFLLTDYTGFYKQDAVAYHLVADGQLDRFPLEDDTVLYGAWNLVDGQLQLTPTLYSGGSPFVPNRRGFRWDGVKFISVSPVPQPARVTKTSELTEDDANDDEDQDADGQFLNKSSRQQFKAAGWHYKILNGYQASGSEATLPINLANSTFNLTIESAPPRASATIFEYPLFGAKSLRLSGDKLHTGSQLLWSQSGWRTITQGEYEALRQKYGRQYRGRFAWTPLVILGLLIVWKLSSWFNLLFAFGTTKRRVLASMATSISFPPATPAQFPALNIEALDRYTRELEGMGFTRLMDVSLVTDSPTWPATFTRVFGHTRHHCFGVVSQMFPRGKAPLPLRCGFEGCLQDGWTLGFTNGKPQAAGSLVRRQKALGVCMPDASSSDLLQAFLKMREQVCLDLSISPVNDDSMQAFINKTQRAIGEIREAVQQKNFVKGLPEVYLRKFSLRKAKPEYVWLGDYPKEAELRKKGLSGFAVAGK